MFATVFLVAAIMGSPQIPEKDPAKNPLASVKTLKCSFSTSSTGVWKGGTPEVQLKNDPISFDVDSIDTQEGSARLVTAEPTYLTALLTASSIHFMERTLQGSLTITTVFSIESTPGRLRAVRSRHEYLKISLPGFASEPAISQYYGECVAGR